MTQNQAAQSFKQFGRELFRRQAAFFPTPKAFQIVRMNLDGPLWRVDFPGDGNLDFRLDDETDAIHVLMVEPDFLKARFQTGVEQIEAETLRHRSIALKNERRRIAGQMIGEIDEKRRILNLLRQGIMIDEAVLPGQIRKFVAVEYRITARDERMNDVELTHHVVQVDAHPVEDAREFKCDLGGMLLLVGLLRPDLIRFAPQESEQTVSLWRRPFGLSGGPVFPRGRKRPLDLAQDAFRFQIRKRHPSGVRDFPEFPGFAQGVCRSGVQIRIGGFQKRLILWRGGFAGGHKRLTCGRRERLYYTYPLNCFGKTIMDISSVNHLVAAANLEQTGDSVGILTLRKAIQLEGELALQLVEAVPQLPVNPPNLGQGVDIMA